MIEMCIRDSSTDTEKMARALRNGHILNNYIVAVCDERVVAFIALMTDEVRAFHIPCLLYTSRCV